MFKSLNFSSSGWSSLDFLHCSYLFHYADNKLENKYFPSNVRFSASFVNCLEIRSPKLLKGPSRMEHKMTMQKWMRQQMKSRHTHLQQWLWHQWQWQHWQSVLCVILEGNKKILVNINHIVTSTITFLKKLCWQNFLLNLLRFKWFDFVKRGRNHEKVHVFPVLQSKDKILRKFWKFLHNFNWSKIFFYSTYVNPNYSLTQR